MLECTCSTVSFVFGSLPYFCKSTEFFFLKSHIHQRHKILSRLLLFISSSSSIKRDKSTIRTNERRRRRRRRRGSFLCRGYIFWRRQNEPRERRKEKTEKSKEERNYRRDDDGFEERSGNRHQKLLDVHLWISMQRNDRFIETRTTKREEE